MEKILIAEDIKIISLHLKKILLQLNKSRTHISESTDNTLKFLSSEEKTDLLFLSDTLIGTNKIPDSFQLLKKLMETHPNLKIVIITGQGKKQNILKFITHGAKTYIEKPLNNEKIQNVLTELNIQLQ